MCQWHFKRKKSYLSVNYGLILKCHSFQNQNGGFFHLLNTSFFTTNIYLYSFYPCFFRSLFLSFFRKGRFSSTQLLNKNIFVYFSEVEFIMMREKISKQNVLRKNAAFPTWVRAVMSIHFENNHADMNWRLLCIWRLSISFCLAIDIIVVHCLLSLILLNILIYSDVVWKLTVPHWNSTF